MRIVITGGFGFLGSNVVRILKDDFEVIPCSRRTGVDIRDYLQISGFLNKINPDLVVHCAAHVGGIAYNEEKPIEIFEDNLKIGMNIVKACSDVGVQRFINIMPNCTYPGHLEIYREKDWWNGEIHESVLTYGLPRKMLWGLSWAYKKKGILDSVHLIFPNMYGPGDHFDPLRSHALGALISKVFNAKKRNEKKIEIWGTGKPIREWLYVEDGAYSILLSIKNFEKIGIKPLNIGISKGISIAEMANIIKEEVGWSGEFIYCPDRPDGAMIKILEADRMKRIFNWEPPCGLREGIKKTVEWYIKNESKSI